jgi:hypothetical protein
MNQTPNEGVVKYQLDWVKAAAPDRTELADLLRVRKILFDLGLIGWDEKEKVGYGNISVRRPGSDTFYVSGTQTSGIPDARADHFTEVTSWDFGRNFLHCAGPVAASSEALTHAMLYTLSPAIGAVIHVHHAAMWQRWMGKVPTTSEEVEYGTQAMAEEVRRLHASGALPEARILVMRGHQDGLISFGATPKEALEVLLMHHQP